MVKENAAGVLNLEGATDAATVKDWGLGGAAVLAILMSVAFKGLFKKHGTPCFDKGKCQRGSKGFGV